MLSHRDLKAIQEGNRRHPDVMTLLREVKRLRDLAAEAYSVLGHMPTNDLPPQIGDKIWPLCDALRAEPAVQEYKRMQEKRVEIEARRRAAIERDNARRDQTDTPGTQIDSRVAK